MADIINGLSLRSVGSPAETNIYKLEAGSFRNEYRIVSSPGTRWLMASPEVVGYDAYLSMLPATREAMGQLRKDGLLGEDVNILTILRGGLNYPLEECCHSLGIRVTNMQFVSCERVIRNGVIEGLDLRYEKLVVCRDCTLMIGDIIATGDTFRRCLKEVVDIFHRGGGSIRRIIVFTIGGMEAIPLLEGLTEFVRGLFPDFEGCCCVFYEGAFGLYKDKGVTGVNVPGIDFGWKGGVISPDFRRHILSTADALFEKCIIYDGGARRYEIPMHCKEVLDYWNDLLEAAPASSMRDFVEEKAGHRPDSDFNFWKEVCVYRDLDGLEDLYSEEKAFLLAAEGRSLEEICRRRISEFSGAMADYINN